VGPLGGVAVIAIRQALDALDALRKLATTGNIDSLITHLPHALQELVARVRDFLPPLDNTNLGAGLADKVLKGSTWAAGLAGGALRITTELLFDLVIMLLTMYVLLVDGRGAVTWLIDASPLQRSDTQALLIEFKKATRAILTSTLATAGAQSLLSTIGYLIARAPRPVFFGIVTLLCAFIPGVGTALVGVPLVAYLFLSGHKGSAIFLGIYFVLVVSLVDNLLKPMLMKSGMRMHGAIVFLALVGGVLAFDAVGLIAGPLCVTFFLAMVRLRERNEAPMTATGS
jgi:predicted PurR-regulated permease PerM